MPTHDIPKLNFTTSALQQEKRCIFCGQKPNNKNKEHVIPRWLIALTGSPTREWHLGVQTSEPEKPDRRFSADRYTFPACEKCNNSYSGLEAKAKESIQKLLDDDDLLGGEWDNLLDWFDKVRIGLWIGNMILNKDWPIPDPNFYINQRLAKKDRLLLVYEYENPNDTGLIMTGASDPVFFHYPSTFLLVINKLIFVNASYEFMLTARMGFPYPKETWYGKGKDSNKRFLREFTATYNPRIPLMRFNFYPAKWSSYQTILINPEMRGDDYQRLIADKYVESKTIAGEPNKTLVCTTASGRPSFIAPGDRLERLSQGRPLKSLRDHQIRLFEFRRRLLGQSLQEQPDLRKIIKTMIEFNNSGIKYTKNL